MMNRIAVTSWPSEKEKINRYESSAHNLRPDLRHRFSMECLEEAGSVYCFTYRYGDVCSRALKNVRRRFWAWFVANKGPIMSFLLEPSVKPQYLSYSLNGVHGDDDKHWMYCWCYSAGRSQLSIARTVPPPIAITSSLETSVIWEHLAPYPDRWSVVKFSSAGVQGRRQGVREL